MVGDPGQLRGARSALCFFGMFLPASRGGKELGNRVGGKLRLFTDSIDGREICVSSQHAGTGGVWFASPTRFPGEKMVRNGGPAGTANAGARDASCIAPGRSGPSVGPCEGPGVGGKQHRGPGGMGTGSDSPVPGPGDIWPCFFPAAWEEERLFPGSQGSLERRNR